MPETPEQLARQRIDVQLAACGWVVQDYKSADFSGGRGIALREVPLTTGPCDYLLLVDRKALGVIEAKKEGATLSTVAEQSARYANSLPDFLAAGLTGSLPFRHESTGIETFFRDERDPAPRSRRVFTFHRPETLAEWAAELDTLRARLKAMPSAQPLATLGMRDCQIEAITGLEQSFAEDRPRALIHMATGAGKTFTACAFTYRLIKYAKARRVLFLVDRANLGEQARAEFHRYRTPDTGRLFTELYNVQHLTSPHLDDVCRVTICTIQRLYSILRGEELAEGTDDLSGAELAAVLGVTRTRDIAYNPAVPIEKFDFIVTDECHRSIYNLWRQVLEYFDASLIGLTATPAPQTIAYFHQNRVAEYNHERAVTDGVNVGYDVYRIKTKITEAGGKVEKGFLIDHRSKASRKARQEVLADDLDYTPADLDRSVVVPDQIRTILRTYRDVVQTELFPGGRDEDTLTTLAARLARLDRELEPTQRQQIVTASGGHTPATLAGALLRAFDPDEVEAASRRLLEAEEHDRVQTIATFFDPSAPITITEANLPHWKQDGVTYFVTFRLVDSLPQERLQQWIADRDRWLAAHPQPLSEQDKTEYHTHFSAVLDLWLDQGLGSNVLELEECRILVADALRHFDGRRYKLGEFVVASNHVHLIVTPLPGNELSDILHSWKSYTAKEIIKVEAASRRLQSWWDKLHERRLATAAKEDPSQYRAITLQRPVWQKESFDHIVRSAARLQKFVQYIRDHRESGLSPLSSEQAEQKRRDAASTLLIASACAPFDKPALRQTLETLKQETEQALDIYTPDEVLEQGFDAAAKAKAAGLVQAFRDYLAQNQAQIDALQILYSRPFKQRLTEPMLKELEKKLRDTHATWTEDRLWDAFAVTAPGKVKGRSQAGRFADLVSLVRFALEQQPVLTPFADSVSERFHEWLMDKAKAGDLFTPEQLAWLGLIRDHIATSLSIDPEDFEYTPFGERGGLGKAHQLFGEQLLALLEELNTTLAA